MADAEILQTALDRFRLTADTEEAQRTREVEDLRFVDWDEQWPDDVKTSRQGQQAGAGLPPVPPRPCLTINKLRQPVQQVVNQARSSRLQLQFAPKGNGASKATAEVFEDIARAVQVDSRAHLARNWAFERAAKCGRGAYRIITDYANDGDFDLDIVYKRILNQSSVYFDPFAQEPDWSDGEWCFITESLPLERYKRQFPDSTMAGMDDEALTAVGDDNPGWVVGGSDDKDTGTSIRIAEYFYIQHEPRTITATDGDGQTRSRVVDDRKVMWCKLNAVEIIDGPQEWDGRYIPVIPVIGDESNINGQRRWQGLVRPSMDAQRSYNYMRSAQVEGVGLAPKAPFVGYAETIEGYEAWWAQSNTRNFPYLPVKFVRDASGNALPPPQRNAVEPAIQAITMAAHEASDDIHSTSGVPPVALGQLDPHERSGKAIQSLQQQADLGSAAYLDNLANMSMQYEGKILRDLIPRIYDRPGRVVAAMGADEQRKLVMVGQPFVEGRDGQPQAVAPGTQGATTIDLKAGEYTVAVKVGKAYTTRLEQQGAMLSDIAQAAPQLLPAFADIWVEDMDIPGGQRIADRVRKVTGMGDDDQQPEIPPEVQQKLQQAEQQIAELSQLADKNKTDLMKAQMQAQADLEKAQMDGQIRLQVAGIQAESSIATAEIKAGMDDFAVRMAHIEALIGMQHERQMAAQSHEQALEQSEQGAMHATDQMREQAALQPAPEAE